MGLGCQRLCGFGRGRRDLRGGSFRLPFRRGNVRSGVRRVCGGRVESGLRSFLSRSRCLVVGCVCFSQLGVGRVTGVVNSARSTMGRGRCQVYGGLEGSTGGFRGGC